MTSPPTNDQSSASNTQRMRWNAACVLLCASAVVFELLALWLIVSANARAQRQADAVVAAVKRASAVEFSLQPQTLYRYNQLHRDGPSNGADEEAEALSRPDGDATGGVVVTGRLVPRLSEDTGRLRFDGHMRVRRNVTLPSSQSPSSSSSASSSTFPSWNEAANGDGEEEELLVLKQQRGVRYSTITANSHDNEGAAADDDEVKCLQPRDVPPLYTVEAASQTAFAAQSFASFGAHCKRGRPLEVLFDRLPFVICALDWFDDMDACVGSSSRLHHPPSLFPTPAPTANKEVAMATAPGCDKAPPLVIYGEHVVLEVTLVFAPGETEPSADSNTRSMTHCQLLEAPMTTAALATQSVLFHLLPRPTLLKPGNASSAAQLKSLM